MARSKRSPLEAFLTHVLTAPIEDVKRDLAAAQAAVAARQQVIRPRREAATFGKSTEAAQEAVPPQRRFTEPPKSSDVVPLGTPRPSRRARKVLDRINASTPPAPLPDEAANEVVEKH